jgi:hypothetical protein
LNRSTWYKRKCAQENLHATKLSKQLLRQIAQSWFNRDEFPVAGEQFSPDKPQETRHFANLKTIG